ncbi:hypothetical protein [Sphingobacterium wenxiniae]|uniref:Uncharacterized protein n=1 Tax=Sphingobacterium wenxiniae TaxID=683125 RepID=A0A1I6RZG0_9SPHI|nr:hypothetical protein [Sphingobacterium wenxiniae]SFS70093.1 hypothetical protein SAMN05660206_10439 [Sphingobacterium wenxiniae]
MSTIKERVLLIAESKGINKVDFFKDLGLSYANFKGVQKSSALSSDAVAAILARHYDISPAWLIADEGDMYRTGAAGVRDKHNFYKGTDEIDEERKLIAALEQTVRSQEKTIFSLEKQVALLEEKIAALQKG